MFPCGFAYRKEEPQDVVVTGPFVNKMGNSTGDDHKYYAYDDIFFLLIDSIHNNILCRK